MLFEVEYTSSSKTVKEIDPMITIELDAIPNQRVIDENREGKKRERDVLEQIFVRKECFSGLNYT